MKCYVCNVLFVFRHAYPREPAAGHSADAGQRPPPLLLRLLHLRHHRRPAVGGAAEEPLLPGGELHTVSHRLFRECVCFCQRVNKRARERSQV